MNIYFKCFNASFYKTFFMNSKMFNYFTIFSVLFIFLHLNNFQLMLCLLFLLENKRIHLNIKIIILEFKRIIYYNEWMVERFFFCFYNLNVLYHFIFISQISKIKNEIYNSFPCIQIECYFILHSSINSVA